MPGLQHQKRHSQRRSKPDSVGTARLSTLVTDFVALKVDGRDGAVLLQGLTQCLDCYTRSGTPRGDQNQTLLAPTARLSTLVTDFVAFKVDFRDGAVLLQGLTQCLDCYTRGAQHSEAS